MDVYLIRHAIAADRDPHRWPTDRERPLTDEGVARMRRAAKGLRQMVPDVDAVYSSPLVRSWQTAEILREEAGWPAPSDMIELEPDGTAEDVVRALSQHAHVRSIALVGHEPLLSDLASFLLTGQGSRQVRIEMKKGAVACLGVGGQPGQGSAWLRWLLPPKALRSL